ncbi:hypothetical protein FNV43_RR09822 [Rhamnella rubrinervis]|uniref:C2H2-type domain-containing protein n=1 Tax=Rhamnella rubrinervis TaxID=2594499 RepID=A0A8K0HC18_9ROSA|nr:hypothetical protein FNV43_RR09822 [Rhamnella rubrinervis]
MEQARYWTWSNRKQGLSSDLQVSTNPSYDDSWEEQAFAEDAAGSLGGCIWPPRSYSCSFCRREFRSAQALGGHMNVHRRDRARLKQSPNLQNEISLRDHDHGNQNHQTTVQNPFSSLGLQYPSQVCAVVYNPNPNSDPGVITSPTTISAQLCKHDCGEQSLFPPYLSSSILEKNRKRSSGISSPQSLSNLSVDRYYHNSNQRNGENISRAKGDFVKTDLSVSLNLVVCHACPTMSEGKEEAVSFKRRRTETSSVSSFPKSSSVDKLQCQSDVLHEHSPRSIEDLDLELRLGDRPTVK